MKRQAYQSFFSGRSLAAAMLAGFGAVGTAQAVTVYDNGGPLAGGNAQQISSAVTANDFLLDEEVELTGFTFWASVGNGESFAANFGGTISWAIFTGGGDIPGTLLFSGHDSDVVTAATGLLNLDGGEIVQVDVDMLPSVTLDAGLYWLAIHEGEWASVFDGTELFWQRTALVTGTPIRIDPSETDPFRWPLSSEFDGAFVIRGNVSGPGGPGDGDDDDDEAPDGPGGPGGPPGAATPEPATAMLGMLGLIALGRRRGRSA